MLREYDDLTSRLGAPLWWDDNGAPRYDPFSPRMLGVYDHLAALVLIACHCCGEEFRVAVSWSDHAFVTGALPIPPDAGPRDPLRDRLPRPRTAPGRYHYGDPPRHGCVGDTMNCNDLRVLEFWERDWDAPDGWRRLPEEEVPLPDHPDWRPEVQPAATDGV